METLPNTWFIKMTLATKVLFKNCIQNKSSTYFYSVNYVNINYSVKYSTVDCNYLLFLQDYFFRSKPKHYKKCQYSWLFKKNIWKLIKQNKLTVKWFDELSDKKPSEN